MKQKVFTLLTLLVLCVTGAWAYEGASGDATFNTKINNSGRAIKVANGCYYYRPGSGYNFSDGNGVKTQSNASSAVFYLSGQTNVTIDVKHTESKNAHTVTASVYSLTESQYAAFYAITSETAVSFTLPTTPSTTFTVDVKAESKTFTGTKKLEGGYYAIVVVGEKGNTYFNGMHFTPAAPTITTQPVGASYVTGDPISSLTVAATASAGDLSYQWYSCNDAEKTSAAAIGGATNSSYTPSAAGFYYVVVTDSNGSTTSNVVEITISAATAPTISVSASATEVTAGTSITLTATKDGVPTPTLKWYISDTNSTSAGSEITGETADTYTFDAIAGTKYYYAKAFNSEAVEGVASNIITITAAARTGCKLNQVVFSNGFDAFITDPVDAVHGTIKAYYLSGSSAPTIASTNKSDGSEYTLEGNTFTLTSEDGNTTKVYDVTIEAVEPYTEDGMTFNGTETWIKTGNAFSESKSGWVFSKNDADWTRETPGKNRIYFFLGANTSVTFTQGISRAIKVYKNGSYVADKTGTFTVDGESSPYMLAIVSNQTSGDGSYKSISVTGAATTVSSVNITPAKEYITYVPTHDLDFTTAAELTAYIATAATASTVTMVSVDKVPAGTPIVIKATAIGSPIAVSKAASTDDVSGNKLKIGDGSTSIGGSGKFDYILKDGLFCKVTTASALAAGKCYLHLEAAPAAKELTIDFEDGDVTAIKAVETKKVENGVFYNLEWQEGRSEIISVIRDIRVQH